MLSIRASQPAFDMTMTMTCDDLHDTEPRNDQEKGQPTRNVPPKVPKLFIPMPLRRFSIDSGLARFSPTVVTRAPLPILNLPSLATPIQRPAKEEDANLRSVPGLPREGQESEHEGDSDSEEEDFVDAEDGDDEANRSSSSIELDNYIPTIRPPKPTRAVPRRPDSPNRNRNSFLPRVDTTPVDFSFMNGLSSPTIPRLTSKDKGKGRATGVSSHSTQSTDYFSFSSNSSTPWNTVSARDGAAGIRTDRDQTPKPQDMPLAFKFPATPSPKPNVAESKPGLYKVGSRSMIHLLGPSISAPAVIKGKEKENDVDEPIPPPTSPTSPVGTSGTGGSSKRQRRRSMPTFTAKDDPPPYPDPEFKFSKVRQSVVAPDMDILPPYSNSIYILGTEIPLKMEFERPGVQAKDRKWKRVTCELEGTAFRLYNPKAATRHSHSNSKGSSIKNWWERRVGVGDISGEQASPAPVKPVAGVTKLTDDTGRRLDLDDDEGVTELFVVPPSPTMNGGPLPSANLSPPDSSTSISSAGSSRSKFSQLLRPSSEKSRNRSHSRSKSDLLPASPHSQSPSARSSFSFSRPSLSVEDSMRSGGASSSSSSLAPRPSTSCSSNSSFSMIDTRPPIDPSYHIRSYTLQNSESGLANDYHKRPNVIRIRMEGCQFLLQMRAVHEVVEWIEALQAATNIALDLDERVMPKGPIFPRRRRRRGVPRPPRTDASATNTAAPLLASTNRPPPTTT